MTYVAESKVIQSGPKVGIQVYSISVYYIMYTYFWPTLYDGSL